MTAEPWSKFFWSDYYADEGLGICSLAAQGLWMRMLCLMAKSTPKGELRIGGEPCTVADLSRAVGEREETVSSLLAELRRRGVYSVNKAGVIYNRRMRIDGELSRKRAEAGKLGAARTNQKTKENPDLPRQKSGKASGKDAAPEARSQKLEARSKENAHAIPDDIRAVMEAGGYVSPPDDLALLRDWYAASATLDQDIVPIIRREAGTLRERTGQAPRTLKIFDRAIREKLAADAHEIELLEAKTRRLRSATP